MFFFCIILLFLKNLMVMINALIVHLQKVDMDILTPINVIQNTTCFGKNVSRKYAP